MSSPSTLPADFVLDIQKQIDINASAKDVFETIISQEAMVPAEGPQMNLTLEPWPGGRWFRDLGNNTGHLWGHVQVIKPPTLLEICGPMFMSYPVASHIQYRLTETAGVTRLQLSHRAFGLIQKEHRDNVTAGWQSILQSIKQAAEK